MSIIVSLRPMWKNLSTFFLYSLVIGLMSCQDNFEKIRKTASMEDRYTKALEYFEGEDYLKAQYLFEDLIGLLRGDQRAEKIYFFYAYTHYHLKNYTFGAYYFKRFATTYPNSEFAEEALYMSAFSNYHLSPIFRLDQTNTVKAIEGFQLFINSYPESSRVAECNQLIDELRRKQEEKAFESASLYFQLSNFKSASYSFKALLKEYPDTQNAEKIRLMIVKSNYRLALNSITSKQIERFEETMTAFEDFKTRYPSSEFMKEATNIYDTSVQKLKRLRNE